MKIATFNINGVKARIAALTDWLEEARPDVVLLQEIKSVDETFPRSVIEDLGYNVETHGQKGFNGVAILSRLPLEDVSRGLPGDESDEQARWIEATVRGERHAVRLCGLYLPNGNPAPGPKYDYKLAWMERLEARARPCSRRRTRAYGRRLQRHSAGRGRRKTAGLGAGCALPAADARRLPAHPQPRFHRCVPGAHPGPGHYSFWDYQAGAWERNNGIRIDHFLLSPPCADLLRACEIDSDVRGREKPSDHVPIWVDLAA